MNFEETLIKLEDEGWRALSAGRGSEFYDGILTEDAALALPVGIIGRDECIEAFRQTPPWSHYEMTDVRVLQIDGQSGIVVYKARAQRDGAPEYVALMSSTYVRRGDIWKLAFHQQTPLTNGETSA